MKTKALHLWVACIAGTGALPAQNLNWDGQTGIWTTPLAATAASPKGGFGAPIVGYHYVNLSGIIGGFNQFSLTEGVGSRSEFGYSRAVHLSGDNPALSPAWGAGFNTFHGKLNVIREDAWKTKWIPAVSGGFVVRSQMRNAGGYLTGKDTTNADFYVVATKLVTQTKIIPIVLNAGYKATNASIFGLAVNAPAYTGRAFGALGLVFRGPSKSTLILACEITQQPKYIQDLPGAVVPTTLVYAVRFLPAMEHGKLNIDAGIAQVANRVAPGVALDARHQFAIGASYMFPGR